ncbi:hypothetical protein AT575_04005 [Streptococcus penaeicida]|uniref:DUF3862 domain-containing protein n=1 Tax=Streptococcus penaeicida TaxID=1765960 RepID=A0A2N8LD09_9STRE|nr:DUF3862 domain-containing protein [Streptococcus penaeicida]PND48049.1 hypothetical protein AT575_04005 [Streptococcus penaeicida]
MKKTNKLIITALLPLLCIGMVACSKDKETSSKGSDNKDSLAIKEAPTAPHQDKRIAFEKVHIATAETQFKGGSTIEELKALYGEPTKHEKQPAGNVTLDNYTWTFDNVTVQANMYENSTIVKSIANFAFARKPKVSLQDYNKLKKGMTYNQVTKILTEPDDYTHASSSDKVQTQAVWVSGLKTTVRGTNISLLFENDKLVKMEQKGLIN